MSEPLEPPVSHPHNGPGIGNVKSAFTKKIGPLPGIVWVILIVVLIYAYRRYRSGQGTTTVSSGVATDATSTDPNVVSGGASYGGAGLSAVTATPSGVTISTNAQWGAAVSNALIAGGADPTAVTNAISKYLNGQTLTAQEQAIINQALQKFGQPPEGVLAVHAPAPKPPTKAVPLPVHPPAEPTPRNPVRATPKPAPKPAPRTYTVKAGDSLSSIAMHFYGSPNWQKIYNANKAKIGANPNLIHPGLVLVIPT